MQRINHFRGKYRFLSNFWPCIVRVDGREYPTLEHAYQASKTRSINDRARIASCATPGDAKRAGKRVPLRSDWAVVKLDVMLELLRQKFSPDSQLAAQLLATESALLVEGNEWGDRFWG